MAHYLKVEYRISPDGQITETVLNGAGSSCTEATAPIEAALGQVKTQEQLPEYSQTSEATDAQSVIPLRQTQP
ncbi:MAG: DUF2997 domain-containing protein [Cyanobacteriota bacterium]|nr:DUF2997 domain-containing protein [Cyanobacteriota bacterium]